MTATGGRALEDKQDANGETRPLLAAVLEKLMLEYLGNKLEEKKSYQHQANLTFFGNLSAQVNAQAALAAYYILCGDPKSVLDLVEQNPSILYCIIEAKDPQDRKVKGTLLQIAAMAGEFDFRNKKREKQGIVESLRVYLPEEEVVRQLQAVFSPRWKKEMKARMKPCLSALNEYVEDLIKAKADTGLEPLRAECKASLDKLKKALIYKADQAITSGYIFDPQILSKAIYLYSSRNKSLGGWYSYKSDLFWIDCFGLLQSKASAFDLQIFKKGLYNLIHDNEELDRVFNFSRAWPEELSGLGTSFFLGIYGRPARATMACVHINPRFIDAYIKQRQQRCQSLCQKEVKCQYLAN